jgi:protease-4
MLSAIARRLHRPLRSVVIGVLIAGTTLGASSVVLALDKKVDKKAEAKTEASTTHVGLIEIHGSPSEQPHPLAWLFGNDEHPTLRQIIDLFKEAAEDKDITVFVVRLREAELRSSQAEEIGQAMQRLRDAGKKVHLFADGYSTVEMLLASYADEAIIQAGGGIMLPGMHMEEMYLADTFAWAGVVPQMVQVGDYKGANEQYMRSAPSPAWDQNINGLLDSLYGNMRTRIKQGRHMDDAQLDEAMKQNWMSLAETGKKTGLIDAIVDLPALDDHLKAKYSSEIEWTNYEVESKGAKIDAANPFSMLSKLTSTPHNHATREAIAIVHIDGPIIDGDSKQGGMFSSESSVGSTTIRRALEDIRDDDLIKGVILRIDSPGGSAIASEVIWQGVKRLRETKPVWVSVGSMAASGGYYILVSGEKVYVNPSSIVGSIGVVGGKMAMGGLYNKAKVHVVERSRGPLGGMMSGASPWNEQQVALVRAKMKETYDLFASRVSAGRSGIDLSKTAEGRLFTGHDAVNLKMADKVGSLDDCIADLAKSQNLTEGEYQILEFPGPKSVAEVFGDMMGGMVSAPNIGASNAIGEQAGAAMLRGAMKEVLGERTFKDVAAQLDALMQLRKEPVLLTSPTAIIVK